VTLRHAAILCLSGFAAAHAWGQNAREEQAVPGIRISGAQLIDQNGAKVRLPDLLKDKVAVINTVFTTCPTICPVMGAHFAALTRLLGDRAAREVTLISISVDPLNDTPARLKAWSEKFHPAQGWTLLTGDPKDIEEVLRGLRLFAIGPENHSPSTLIGDARKGEWRRATGLQSAEKLAALIPSQSPPARATATETKPDRR